MSYKKAFSIIEIIFVIAIISLIASIAIPKLTNSLDKANLVKIKSDIALIRNGLISYKDKMILSNHQNILESLESSDEILFDKILTYPIIASNTPKGGNWSKISNTTYKVYINSQDSINFLYDNIHFTFDCDFSNNICKELNQ